MDNNPKIAALASRIVESNRPDRPRHSSDDEDDTDRLFAELEEEIENDGDAAMREQGLEVLRREMERMQEMQKSHHGEYTEITDEKEVVRVSAHEPRCVVHFYHTNFKRCEIMDKHLKLLAKKYFSTRFFRVFVENVPWLVERLGIKVLPCVICFVDGVSKERLIGFEQLGNSDKFDTAMLELRLSMCGAVQKTGNNFSMDPVYSVVSARDTGEEDEVFDLDD
ncbi:hypothetical protein H0H93_000112 [Arthromyces matolae]|nr:hypothetical protein H0H93_000112 [Arthromyces matolae]